MLTIGVFDSGLGGLTIVKSLQETIKDASLHYIADTIHAPYGTKTPKQILEYSLALTAHLVHHHQINALVVACNTATAFAIEAIREQYPKLIVIGTEPGLKPAFHQSKTKAIGILATEATLQGVKYKKLLNTLVSKQNIEVVEQACIGLVEQIEAGKLDDEHTLAMLDTWLKPMRKKGVDTIVLGCTHYPLVETQIASLMPQGTVLIHTGDAIAARLESLRQDKKDTHVPLEIALCTTGKINTMMVEQILGKKYHIESITIDQ